MKSKQKEKKSKKAPELKIHKKHEQFKGPYIGMDFGTTFLLVSWWNNGKVEILTNPEGNRVTPSYVSFTESDILFGENARAQLFRNPKNTIYNIKKLLGKTYEEIKDNLHEWQFLIKNDNGMPVISISVNGTEKIYKPTEIAGMMYKQLKSIAEICTNSTVTKVVITIPSSFNEAQKNAIMESVKYAGLEPAKLISEAAAAGLSYNLDNIKGERNIIVFHIGGGSYDISLLKSNDGFLELLGKYTDETMHGKIFDERIIKFCVEEFEKKYKVNISKNIKAIKKLELLCENAKNVLSVATSVPIEVETLAEGIDFSVKLYRAKYEEICSDLFAKILPPIDKILSQNNLDKSQIDDIIIEGGMGKTPKIADMLKKYFDKEPKTNIDPDEAVVYGAALQAQFLRNPSYLNENCITNVTALTLWIENSPGILKPIIPKGSPIPCKKTFQIELKKPTYSQNLSQKSYVFNAQFWEGESILAYKNKLISRIIMEFDDNILLSKSNIFNIELTIEISENKLIKFTLFDKSQNLQKYSIIEPKLKNTEKIENSKETIQNIEKIGIQNNEELRKLYGYCYNVISIAMKSGAKEEIKNEFVQRKVKDILKWISKMFYNSENEKEIITECQKYKKLLEDELKNLIKSSLLTK